MSLEITVLNKIVYSLIGWNLRFKIKYVCISHWKGNHEEEGRYPVEEGIKRVLGIHETKAQVCIQELSGGREETNQRWAESLEKDLGHGGTN